MKINIMWTLVLFTLDIQLLLVYYQNSLDIFY